MHGASEGGDVHLRADYHCTEICMLRDTHLESENKSLGIGREQFRYPSGPRNLGIEILVCSFEVSEAFELSPIS